jgi:nitric oxide reductase NorD protein
LERESSRKRWILLLSDGKPGDYDRYEGRYGIEDVRQSVRDAEKRGVRVFALAIQAAAKHYLPPLFGYGRFRILPRPQLLPEALTAFYSDLRKC